MRKSSILQPQNTLAQSGGGWMLRNKGAETNIYWIFDDGFFKQPEGVQHGQHCQIIEKVALFQGAGCFLGKTHDSGNRRTIG